MFFDLFELALKNLLFLALHLDNNGIFPRQLTKDEELDCLKRMANGDDSARNYLIEHNLRLVAYIVRKNYADSREQEDLISIGSIGLIRAAQTFNAEKAINFSTYAGKCIDNQIKMHFRKTKRQQTEVYMNEPVDSDKDGNPVTIADIFRDSSNLPEEVDLRINLRKLYKFVNEDLDEREKLIICRRYGLNTTNGVVERPMTQREVAAQLHISRSYISRIEKHALEKLRDKFDIRD